MSYNGGIFGCFSDIPVCVYGCMCGCCLNASNYAKQRGDSLGPWHCLCCHSHFWVHRDVGKSKGDQNTEVIDCLLATFCAPLMMCQDARALGFKSPLEDKKKPKQPAKKKSKSSSSSSS